MTPAMVDPTNTAAAINEAMAIQLPSSQGPEKRSQFMVHTPF
jgi:hypothetical protein